MRDAVGLHPHPERTPVSTEPPITVALLTNILAPYRIPIYNRLATRFNLHVLYSGEEDNRGDWAGSERRLRGIHAKRSAGWSFKYFAPRSGQAPDDRYLHLNPGYLTDLARIRPDAVISAELGFRTACAQAYCAFARVPLWVWWEGSKVSERDIGAPRRILRHVMAPLADRWISGGLNATQYLLSLGIDGSRIVRAQNCVDERFFVNPSAPITALGARPVILVVGRLVPGKGVGLMLDVVATLRAEGRTFSVVIVGDGVEREPLQQKARHLGLDNVAFHLARPWEQLPAYYRGADLLVFPTLHDVWGLVVNEALWSGLPVLASKYAGCADELLPRDQIFDPLNPEDFTAKLRQFMENRLLPVDTTPMMTVQQVADAIGNDIEELVAHRKGRVGHLDS
jgi:glycosyltransferase involved in cell wall biosynthesis